MCATLCLRIVGSPTSSILDVFPTSMCIIPITIKREEKKNIANQILP